MRRALTLLTIVSLFFLNGCGNQNDYSDLKKEELESYFKEEGYTVVKDTMETSKRVHVFIYDAKKFRDAKVIYQFQYLPEDDTETVFFSYTDTEIDKRVIYFVEYNKGKIKSQPTRYDTDENIKIIKKQKAAYKKWLKDLGIKEKQLIDFMIYQAKK